MGDNRMESADSRTYGPVNEDQIKRRIPTPSGSLRAEFLPFTLPASGKTLMRAL